MNRIYVQASKYKPKGGDGARLAVGILNGGGARIKGPKFGDFPSVSEITVTLTLEEARELAEELLKLIPIIIKVEEIL
ncbi:MAG: hypothetical protein PHI40_08505 [Caldisericia bacterium]|nr:hypothetical protein [Caldisericia bacterium]